MDVAADTIRVLVFLLPGVLTLRVIAMKCDLKEQAQQEVLVDALLYSLSYMRLWELLVLIRI